MLKRKDKTTELWAELISEKPSESNVRKLVKEGAIIKGTFLIELMYLINPPDTWKTRKGRGLELNFVNLLIELGAEVNYTNKGVNCLWAACDTYNPDLIEMLLRMGASPNCMSNTGQQSVLDWAQNLLNLETYSFNRGYDRPLKSIIELLEKYGAKSAKELVNYSTPIIIL